MTEAIDQLKTILTDNWSTDNCDPRGYDQISSFIKNILFAPKKVQVANNDFLFLYDITEQYVFPTLTQTVADVTAVISVDIRSNTIAQLNSIKNETLRILNLKIVSIGGGWDRLTYSDLANRSDKSRALYRKVFQVTIYKTEQN